MEKDTIKVFIQTPEENAKFSKVGQWLTLPASAGKLDGLLKQIGADGALEPPFVVSSIKASLDCVRDTLFLSDSLDELNMLARFLSDMEPYETDNLRAILQTGIMAESRGAGGLINLLYEDNMHAFNIIDAGDAAALGEYWLKECPDDVPEDMTPEEYGKYCVAEEKGLFTEWGYVYQRMELSQEYDGVVPEDYKITEAALRSFRSMAAVSVYPHSIEYAIAQGETALYRESERATVACARGIDKAVSDFYLGDFCYDLPGAADDVIGKFGFERLNLVLATVLRKNDYDGRFSQEHKDWARGQSVTDHGDVYCNTHPAILDGFIGNVLKAHTHAMAQAVGRYEQSRHIVEKNRLTVFDSSAGSFAPRKDVTRERLAERHGELMERKETRRASALGRLEAAKQEVKPPAPKTPGKKKDMGLE